MDRVNIVKLSLAALITAALFWLLFRQVSVAQVLETTARIPLWLMLVGFLLFALSHAVRAVRFRLLLQNSQPYRTVFAVTCMHNILLALLPFRLGELSFLYLLQRRGVRVTKSLAVLAVGRLFDVLAMCAYFLLGLWMLMDILPADIHAVGKYAMILIAALLVALYVAVAYASALLKHWHANGKFTQMIAAKLREVAAAIGVLKQQHALWQVSVLSLAIWGLQFVWSWIVFRELLDANFWAIVVGTSLPIISTAIPIQGIAAFGTFEGVWAVVFIAFGIERTLAISSGFAFHILNILYAAILGVCGAMNFSLSAQGKRG